MTREDRIREFVTILWAWYAVHKRQLPWRDLQITDPTERAYRILVSEVMLQQTQVPRVIGAFRAFMELFPALTDLANADNRKVLLAWRGMGYNSRALRLRDAAREILKRKPCHGELSLPRACRGVEPRHGGIAVLRLAQDDNAAFPSSMEELTSIPGIGHYTAAAIRNFAFGIPTPCLDTNIRRVLHRTFIGPENSDGTWRTGDEELLVLAGEVLVEALGYEGNKGKKGKKRNTGSFHSFISPISSISRTTTEWHAALMDFGSLVCTKRNPKWDICPLTRAGVSKTTRKNFELRIAQSAACHPQPKREPGRFVGSTFIPNRIFRGRIVDALRDAEEGLTVSIIGPKISVDWENKLHRRWLDELLHKLIADRLVRREGRRFYLG